MPSETPSIGLLNERPLHASLKRRYARAGDEIEVSVDGYVVDLVRGDLLIEIQTRNFSAIRTKVATLLERGHRLRVVHPIPVDKWIVKTDGDGAHVSRRRSPKHGATTDVFAELVSVVGALTHPRFEVDVVATSVEERWARSEHRAWRRNGWSVMERSLLDLMGSTLLRGADDLRALVPNGLPERFSTADLAAMLGRPRRAAQQMAYCLRSAGIFEPLGRDAGGVIYQLN